jgi:hypothetical protein
LAECAAYAHQFVEDTCEQYFNENLALVCCAIALLVIGVVCVGFSQARATEAVDEEEDLAGDGG